MRSKVPVERGYGIDRALQHQAEEYINMAVRCEENAHGEYHDHVVESLSYLFHDPIKSRKALRINLAISPCSRSTLELLTFLPFDQEKSWAQMDIVRDRNLQ